MGQYVYLLKVEPGANNNKFYEQTEQPDGTFSVKFGRVDSSCQNTSYPMSNWEKKYREKLRKGYEDITAYRGQIVENVSTKNSDGESVISKDKNVTEIIKALQSYARAQTAAVYNVKAVSVTQKQIDDAQICVDNLSNIVKDTFSKSWDINVFNTELLKLFRIIPRKMLKVNDHLITDSWDRTRIEKMVEEEQSNLDSMASQVSQQKAEDVADEVVDNKEKSEETLLESLGIEMELLPTGLEYEKVKHLAQEHGKRVTKVYKVINKNTQKVFDEHLNNVNNKKVELFWHGSRNQNWWFILQQGLKIRPAGVATVGNMFGWGCYFASESDKSMGYTDSGRWVRGQGGSKVYMALYDVHLGKQYETFSSDSSLSKDKLKILGDYNSTWGKKGPHLYRHEYIIYNTSQCTIKYLVEFDN
jgi:poly [ADP-ribose] polymerase